MARTKSELIELGRQEARSVWAQSYADNAKILDRTREEAQGIASLNASDRAANLKTTAAAFHDAFKSEWMSLWQKAYNEQPHVKAQMEEEVRKHLIRRLERKLVGMIENADTVIEKFKNELDANPHYAMRWSDNVFAAAAGKDVALRLKQIFEHPEGGYDSVLKEAREQALRAARSAANQSTSEPANLITRYEMQAYAEIASGYLF